MQTHTLLDEAKAQFYHWRTTRSKRGKIPEHLWDKVKLLIDHYHLTAITKALSLNTNQIRENLNIGTNINLARGNWLGGQQAKQVQPRFVRVNCKFF